MSDNKYHVSPFVPKLPITIIGMDSGNEATALRNVLENFWYQVDLQWIGSREGFVKILSGAIKSEETIIISCHGDTEKGILTLTEEEPVSSEQVREIANLKDKIVINLGCDTGLAGLPNAFLFAGCKMYIAPKGAPFGTSALLFAIQLFYEIKQNKKSMKEAFEKVRHYDDNTKMFELFE